MRPSSPPSADTRETASRRQCGAFSFALLQYTRRQRRPDALCTAYRIAPLERTQFTAEVIRQIKSIPAGYVSTYGMIAAMAGNPRAARQVARVLHSCSARDALPWYRVINAGGNISLPRGGGYERQKALLQREGIVFDETDRVDLQRFMWTMPA